MDCYKIRNYWGLKDTIQYIKELESEETYLEKFEIFESPIIDKIKHSIYTLFSNKNAKICLDLLDIYLYHMEYSEYLQIIM